MEIPKFNFETKTQEIKNFFTSDEYNEKTQRVTTYPAHFIIALFKNETSIIKYLSTKNMIDPKTITLIEPKSQISTIALAVLLNKPLVANYLAENHFRTTKFSDSSEQDILRDLYQKSLKNTWLIRETEEIQLSTWSCQQIDEELKISYQDYIFSPEKNKDKDLKSIINDKKFCEIHNQYTECYKNYYKTPLSLNIVKVENIFRLTAKEYIPASAPIVLSNQAFIDEPFQPQNYYASFNATTNDNQTKRTGNLFNFIRLGFPNATLMAVWNQSKRMVLISLDDISPGEELSYHNIKTNYPLDYNSNYQLVNKEKMVSYFAQEKEHLMEKLMNFKTLWNIKIDEMSFLEKICYAISNPKALIYLHVSELINMTNIFKAKYYIQEIFKKNDENNFEIIKAITRFFTNLDDELSKKSPLKTLIYDFIINHIEKFSVIQLLHLLQNMFTAIKNNELDENNFQSYVEKILDTLNDYQWKTDSDHPISKKNVAFIQNNFVVYMD